MQTWKTTDVPERQQFSFWREVICEAFAALDPGAPDGGAASFPSPFQARVRLARLASLRCATVEAKPHNVRRHAPEIRRDPQEACFFNLQLAGTCVTRQAGRETLVRPGDIAVLDLAAPYSIDVREGFSILCFRADRALLRPWAGAGRMLGAVARGEDATTRVAADFMRALWADAPALSAAPLAGVFAELAGVALGGDVAHRGAEAVLHAARAAVRRGLSDPELSPALVARAIRVSVRSLHAAFAGGGQSFGAYVRQERLARCAAALRDPGDRRAIAEIAWRWGFGDPAHFSRVFRAAYGVSPRAYRGAIAWTAFGPFAGPATLTPPLSPREGE